jgi:hypothetical protein
MDVLAIAAKKKEPKKKKRTEEPTEVATGIIGSDGKEEQEIEFQSLWKIRQLDITMRMSPVKKVLNRCKL